MTVSDRVVAELRKLAEAAEASAPPLVRADRLYDFHAAANPAVVRQLLDDRDAATEQRAVVQFVADELKAIRDFLPNGHRVSDYGWTLDIALNPHSAAAVGVRQHQGELSGEDNKDE